MIFAAKKYRQLLPGAHKAVRLARHTGESMPTRTAGVRRRKKSSLAFLGGSIPPSARPAALRYGVAVLTAAAATLLSVWLRPFTYATPFLFFYPAVILASLIGGFRPGLLATALSSASANYFLLPPYGGFSFGPENLIRTALFALFFASICWLAELARKQLTQSVVESEERYHSLFENMLEGFAYCQMLFDEQDRPADFVYLHVNGSFERLTGLKNVAGRRVTELIPGIKESQPELFEIYGRVARSGKPEKFELEFKPLGVWFAISAYSTEPGYFAAAFEDITERKRAEHKLSLQAAALEAAANSIVITDREGTILWVNPAFSKLTGYAAHEVLGRTPRLLSSGKHDPQFYKKMWNTILSGAVWQGEITNRRKDGTLYSEEMTITPVRSDTGEISHFVAIKVDITAAKKTELQLQQAQKMEAIGRLASGIAHDFNTLLNIILGYSELLLAELPNDNPLRRHVEQIENSANVGALVTKQLLAFGRKHALNAEVIDLRNFVADMQPMLRRLLRESIELVVRCSQEVCPVKADPGQIQQLVLNLVANARDAMPGGGTLTLEVKTVELDEAYVEKHAGMSPGRYEMLAVSDTGTGMDAQTAAHVFEPFFTTKSPGEGTGLGLATVYGIVKQSGGDIWVYSEPGVGSIFKVFLPQASETVEVAEPLQFPQKVAGTETILLVEDSAGLRELTRVLLSRQGYTVLEAVDGIEGLELSGSYPGTIHLLLTDLMMPRMCGAELVEHIMQQRPNIGIVCLSGYSEDVMPHPRSAERLTIIEKPYTSEALLRTVRRVLDETESRVSRKAS